MSSAIEREYPVPESAKTSARMASVPTRHTTPELALRRELHARGLRFRVDRRPLPALRRSADIVFSRARVAVFLDGCFWHGCPSHGSWPKHNEAYWRSKIERNIRRDQDTNTRLEAAGWRVIRVWEHENVSVAADKIVDCIRHTPTVPS